MISTMLTIDKEVISTFYNIDKMFLRQRSHSTFCRSETLHSKNWHSTLPHGAATNVDDCERQICDSAAVKPKPAFFISLALRQCHEHMAWTLISIAINAYNSRHFVLIITFVLINTHFKGSKINGAINLSIATHQSRLGCLVTSGKYEKVSFTYICT
jgi:hypothetical protein